MTTKIKFGVAGLFTIAFVVGALCGTTLLATSYAGSRRTMKTPAAALAAAHPKCSLSIKRKTGKLFSSRLGLTAHQTTTTTILCLPNQPTDGGSYNHDH